MLKLALYLLCLPLSVHAFEIRSYDPDTFAPGTFRSGTWSFASVSNVGISTVGSSAANLDVQGNAQFGSGVTKSTFSTVGALTLDTNATLRVGTTFYVGNGRVGVGTTSPLVALEVNGAVQMGSGVTKSTFAADGALDMALGEPITLSGAGGNLVGVASVTASGIFGVGRALTNLNASNLDTGTVPAARNDSSSVTLQANNFNGATQLVQTNSSSLIPNGLLDSSSITKAGTTFNGASQLVQTNASSLIPNGLLDSSSITKAGTTFNGVSQLVQLDGSGNIALPSNGDLTITGASGFITTASSVTASAFYGSGAGLTGIVVLSATQTFSGQNTFTNQLTFSSNVVISPLTSSSVLFSAGGGQISQDNTNFSWGDTDNTLTINGADSVERLRIRNGAASGATYSTASQAIFEDNGPVFITLGTANAGYSGIIFESPAGSVSPFFEAGILYNTPVARALHLVTGNNQTRMTIETGGDIGIGTTDPTALLEVAGVIETFSRTVAQVQSLTPTAVGQILYCSNCTTPDMCVSTGTAVNQFRRIGTSLGCE